MDWLRIERARASSVAWSLRAMTRTSLPPRLKMTTPKLFRFTSEFCLIASAAVPFRSTTLAAEIPLAIAWKWAALPLDGAGRWYSTITPCANASEDQIGDRKRLAANTNEDELEDSE